MQDNDYNIIKPVENLQNIGALTPIDRRTERRRQGQQKRRRAATDQQDLSADRQDETTGSGSNQAEQGSIDYRA